MRNPCGSAKDTGINRTCSVPEESPRDKLIPLLCANAGKARFEVLHYMNPARPQLKGQRVDFEQSVAGRVIFAAHDRRDVASLFRDYDGRLS